MHNELSSEFSGKLVKMKCKNCGNGVSDNFCSKCGQNTKVGRIDHKHIFREIPDSIFQLNRGLLFTIKELFLGPGTGIKGYLGGKRQGYVKPITYVLLLSTIYGIASTFIDQKTLLGNLIKGISTAHAAKFNTKFDFAMLDWFANNHAYTTVLLVPVFAISSYLIFLEFKLNYFEHIVINAYLTGQQALIYVFFILLQSIISVDNYYFPLIPLAFSFMFALWTFFQLFGKNKSFKITVLTILTYSLYAVFILGCIAVMIVASIWNK